MVLMSASKLSKSYGVRTLFSDVSFEISEGDRVGLVGVNGCGKTTLLRMITGEENSDGGELAPLQAHPPGIRAAACNPRLPPHRLRGGA